MRQHANNRIHDRRILVIACELDCLSKITLCKIETEICLFLCQSHYIRQICQHIALTDWLRLQLQATGFHCFQQLIKICRKQQDHRIRRWLLNRLQHGILCLYIQKLRIRDNVNLILSFIRFDVNCIYELVTNLIH